MCVESLNAMNTSLVNIDIHHGNIIQFYIPYLNVMVKYIPKLYFKKKLYIKEEKFDVGLNYGYDRCMFHAVENIMND